MEQDELPHVATADPEEDPQRHRDLVAEAVARAEQRRADELQRARARAVQLAREQAYHRLAVAIDRPTGAKSARQLSLFGDDPTLFDDAG